MAHETLHADLQEIADQLAALRAGRPELTAALAGLQALLDSAIAAVAPVQEPEPVTADGDGA